LRHGPARTADLAKALGVSVDTVRRDLSHLERQRIVRRTHGGAALVHSARWRESEVPMLAAKRAIAQRAVDFVDAAETVAIDIGSTAREFGRALLSRDPVPRLTVVTNDIYTALELGASESLVVNLTGGRVEQGLLLCGPLTQQTLDSLYFDVAFMGTSGLTLTEGLTDPIPEAALVKRAFIERARRVILLCDHTKFGRRHLMRVASVGAVHVVITDDGAPQAMVEELSRQGIEVVLCSPQESRRAGRTVEEATAGRGE
ncbi:MAG TPA: DeoR/GlpR family DNA-binding transcription regulator, partial [Limnochordia bacterium]